MSDRTNKLNSILITGGAGFIGSNFIPFFLNKNPQYQVINLDKLTYAGDLTNLREVENNDRYKFIKGDICDTGLVDNIFRQHHIDAVIHFAAESHVDRSITEPNHFINTNIIGTYVLLEAAKKFWLDKTDNGLYCRFHHISTDEVYGSLGETGYFNEQTPYAPNSPYSASKASSDFLVRSYHHTYGLDVVTSNCSNNFGPKQHREKFIPTVISTALSGKPIPIYGDGSNIRDWLFVEDHCVGLDLLFHKGVSGESYILGGNNEYNNLYIARKLCQILDELKPKNTGSYSDQLAFVEDRLGHDYRYAIDSSKIKKELNWTPKVSFNDGLRTTVQWYLSKYGY